MPRLAILGPDRAPFTAGLERDSVSVGRSSANDVVLTDPSVSRTHGRFFRRGEHWCYEDAGSRHGSFLNGRRLERRERLEPGDRIDLGAVTVIFEPPDDARALRPTTGAGTTPAPHTILVGESQVMARVRVLAERFAPSSATVLIQGETGTGKELVARLVHELSERSDGPFVVVNCPALPGSLVEAELFGTEKGVATGVDARPGLAESADGGTLFLDEIGDLESSAQAKLLRFLQDRRLRRIGAREPRAVDVRVIAATHHDLPGLVDAGDFRRDLYHRLEVATIEVPALREHAEDLPALIAHFLDLLEGERPRLSEEALSLLMEHDWPGNVRELEHALQRAALLAGAGVIEARHLPRALRLDVGEARPKSGSRPSAESLYRRVVEGSESFWTVVREPYLARELPRDVVRSFIGRVLDECDGSNRELAQRLGCGEEHRKLIDFLRNNSLRPVREQEKSSDADRDRPSGR